MTFASAILWFWIGSVTAVAILSASGRITYPPHNMALDLLIVVALVLIAL